MIVFSAPQNLVRFLLLSALFSCLVGCSRRTSHTPTFGVPAVVTKDGAELEKTGVMSKNDYLRVADLEDRAANGGKLSESEVDWLLALTKRSGTEQQMAKRMFYVTIAFADTPLSSLPPSRVNAVFDLAIQALGYTGKPNHIPVSGCYILSRLKDKRALPYLNTALSSNNIYVRQAARQAIHNLSKLT